MHFTKVKFIATLNLLGLMLVSLALFQNYESGGLIYMLANNETEQVQQYLATYKTFEMYLVVLGLVLVEVIVGIVPAVILYSFAGFLLGNYTAIIIIFLGNFIGNLINYYQGKIIASAFLSKTRHKRHLDKLSNEGAKALFLLRLNPLTSIDSLSYLAGAINMNVKSFLLATNLGVAPLIVLGTLFGSSALNGYRFGYELFIIITFVYLGYVIRKNHLIRKIKTAHKKRKMRRSRSNTEE